MQHKSLTQNVLLGNTAIAAFMATKKIWRHISNWRLFKRKQCAYFGFSKQSPLSKHNVATELNMGEINLQIMLSDAGWSSFERLVVFCTEKEREVRAFHRKLLIEYRKFGQLSASLGVHLEVFRILQYWFYNWQTFLSSPSNSLNSYILFFTVWKL
jgi:hypothetical protein